ncbi:unnamed protein product [Discosporangium mesarthrocarpum]
MLAAAEVRTGFVCLCFFSCGGCLMMTFLVTCSGRVGETRGPEALGWPTPSTTMRPLIAARMLMFPPWLAFLLCLPPGCAKPIVYLYLEVLSVVATTNTMAVAGGGWMGEGMVTTM